MGEQHRKGRQIRLMLSDEELHKLRMAAAHRNQTMSAATKQLVRQFIGEWEQGRDIARFSRSGRK
jgi:hypothetical protein